MSDNPLLSKMDALLRKHRGSAASPSTTAAPAPDVWLPVLTDVIEQGNPPPAVVAEASVPPAAAAEPAAAAASEAAAPPTLVTDTLAEQLMSELAPRLSQIMERQVAAELRRNLDDTVATLLTQLDVNVREIVRDAVAEKLKPHLDPGPDK
jgi:hypothetical protein